MFAAVGVKGQPATWRACWKRPCPPWKLFGDAGPPTAPAAPTYGLPRSRAARFEARFPFGSGDCATTSAARGHADRLEPVRAERHRRVQPARGRARIPHRQPRPHPARRRVLVPRAQLHGHPRQAAGGPARSTADSCCRAAPTRTSRRTTAASRSSSTSRARAVDHAWFRGGWWDPLTMAWKAVDRRRDDRAIRRSRRAKPAPGGSCSCR